MSVTGNLVLGEKLSVSLAGGGSGSVVSNDGAINCASPGGSYSSLYLPGANVSLTAVASGTSAFGAWSSGCTGTNPHACGEAMNSVQSDSATFNPPPGDFSLIPASASISIQKEAQVADVLTITAPATLAAFAFPRNHGNNTARRNWCVFGEFQEVARGIPAARRWRHALVRCTRRMRHFGAGAPELHGDGQRNVRILTELEDGDAQRSMKKSGNFQERGQETLIRSSPE